MIYSYAHTAGRAVNIDVMAVLVLQVSGISIPTYFDPREVL